MFDDPKRELRRMQEELLAVEREQREQEELEALLAQEEQWLREAGMPELDVPIRNHANGYGAGAQEPAGADFTRSVYADEELDEDAAVLDEDPPPKGAGGLVLLALLEIAGILALVLWWVRWLNGR